MKLNSHEKAQFKARSDAYKKKMSTISSIQAIVALALSYGLVAYCIVRVIIDSLNK